MKATINCITLPVDDIQQSFKFYQDGLGLTAEKPTEDADHVAFTLEGKLYLVIILREEFRKFATKAKQTYAPKGSSECILSCFTGSKEEVDIIISRAAAAGAVTTGEPKQEPWGYAGYFNDPDGHVWEIMWNSNL